MTDTTERRKAGRPWDAWGSLRFQLAVGIALLMWASAGVVVFLATHQLESAHLEQIQKEQASNVHAVASWIDSEVKERLRALASMARPRDAAFWSDPARLQAYLDDKPIALSIFRQGIHIVSPAGVRMAEAPMRGHAGTSELDSPHVQRVLATKRPVAMPLVDRFSGMPTLIFAVPVFDAADRVVAIVCGTENLSQGSNFYLPDFARNGVSGG